MSIADNIKALREKHGISQIELAQIIGVTDKAISAWETGQKTPRMGNIQKMADYFGLEKSDIIEDVTKNPLSQRIRNRRKELGLSISSIASKTNIDARQIEEWERDIDPKTVNENALKRLCDALKINPLFFKGFIEKDTGVEIILPLETETIEEVSLLQCFRSLSYANKQFLLKQAKLLMLEDTTAIDK